MKKSHQRSYPMMQVDAFTKTPLGGNPCAVFFEADSLSEAEMQAIAREMNLSESAFVMPSEHADFKVRYFTPAEEIPLAGHPTIATTFALFHSGRAQLNGEITTITLEMKAGIIPVEVVSQAGHIQSIVMNQKKPVFGAILAPERVLPVFDLREYDLLPGAPIQIVSTGTPQLMLLLESLDSLRQAHVNIPAYIQLRQETGFFSPHLFCLQGATPAGRTFARHFGTPPDLFEDPFTGSATGGMAAYLWRYGYLDQPNFIAEQGHWMGRPGQATVEVVGSPEQIETVRVGGPAVAILTGELTL